MEEDIKILEEFIKDVIPKYTETYVNGKKIRIDLIEIETKPSKKIAQAIGNLLKRYKELEEGCKTCVIRNDLNDYVENSIPISVIQNKIDELEKLEKGFNMSALITECEIKIEVLQELLQESKK